MYNGKNFSGVLLSGLAMCTLFSAPSFGQVVVVKEESVAQLKIQAARALGKGCPQGQLKLSASSAQELIAEGVLSQIVLDESSAVLSEIANCTIAVPVIIPQGFYPVSVAPLLKYTLEKSAGSSFYLAAQVTLGSEKYPIRHHLYKVGVQSAAVGTKVLFREDATSDIGISQDWCSANRSEQSLLKVTVSSNGQRDDATETLISRVIGTDSVPLLGAIKLAPCLAP